MRNPLAAALVLALLCPPLAGIARQREGAGANSDALVQQDFKKRIDAYLAVHDAAVKSVGALKQTSDPAEIKAGQNALAQRISAARAAAQPGDIFTPEISRRFRELLAPQVKGEEGRDARAVAKDDAPRSVPFKVNTPYPEGASLPTVPAKILLNLPALPKQMDYRLIGKHLILRDADANLIVDYMLNAIP